MAATMGEAMPASSERSIREQSPQREGTEFSGQKAQPSLLSSILSGLLVLVLVGGAGAAAVLAQGKSYKASGQLVVTPHRTDNVQSEATLYQTLVSGQIVSTVARVIDQDTTPRPSGSSVSVSVVPSSSVVVIAGTASTKAAAVTAAANRLNDASAAVGRLALPFVVKTLDEPSSSITDAGTPRTKALGAVAIVAVILGFLTQQVVSRRRRGGSSRVVYDDY
jgi:hypothetical protein